VAWRDRGRGKSKIALLGIFAELELAIHVCTSRHDGPETRTMAMPARPGAVDSAYTVSGPKEGDSSTRSGK
jgi:hypothetical protein